MFSCGDGGMFTGKVVSGMGVVACLPVGSLVACFHVGVVACFHVGSLVACFHVGVVACLPVTPQAVACFRVGEVACLPVRSLVACFHVVAGGMFTCKVVSGMVYVGQWHEGC
jgi:hypothetical protein